MEGLVSEVSIIAEAVKDSAPSWPLVQLHRLTLCRSSACGCILNPYLLCTVAKRSFIVSLVACVQQSGVVTVCAAARRDVLKSTVALAMAGFTMRHCPLRSL